ncbi:MAG: NAD-dependent epimerase/dehydratase family protein, partial [Candidatus Pacearchaeota archaeon]|nr:NAD-dependent epimerase/dehydratase family protein [Candidatus Pacearchaeota archaeon]
MLQRILISGYTGFIGSNLTNNLKGQELYGVDIIKNDSVLKHFQWEELNKCIDCQLFIHLAGIVHDTKNITSDEKYFNINVGLTQKIFQQFLISTANKFIFFSSVKAVRDSFEGQILNEEVSPNPETAYGRSKLEAEMYILNEFEKWKEDE